jgi:hypothetical protein
MPALDVTPETAPVCPAHPERKAYRACDRCGTFLCAVCTFPTETGPLCEPCTQLRPKKKEPLWQGFLLPLAFLGLVLNPLITAVTFASTLGPARDGWADPAVTGGWRSWILLWAALSLAQTAVAIWTVPLFLMRRSAVPSRMLIFYGLGLARLLLELTLGRAVELVASGGGYPDLVAVGWSLVWLAYFAYAPQVKRVFVR